MGWTLGKCCMRFHCKADFTMPTIAFRAILRAASVGTRGICLFASPRTIKKDNEEKTHTTPSHWFKQLFVIVYIEPLVCQVTQNKSLALKSTDKMQSFREHDKFICVKLGQSVFHAFKTNKITWFYLTIYKQYTWLSMSPLRSGAVRLGQSRLL